MYGVELRASAQALPVVSPFPLNDKGEMMKKILLVIFILPLISYARPDMNEMIYKGRMMFQGSGSIWLHIRRVKTC